MAALKHSRQRESIRKYLKETTTHPTADTVYENMKLIYPNISLGTVYRNLSLLAELGEIRKLTNYGGADRYDGHIYPHSHFICTECGKIMDLKVEINDALLKEVGDNFSGQIIGCSARFFGLCEDCMKKCKNTKKMLDMSENMC